MKKKDILFNKHSLQNFWVIVFLFGLRVNGHSADVVLQWNPNSEASLAGYKVYHTPAVENAFSNIVTIPQIISLNTSILSQTNNCPVTVTVPKNLFATVKTMSYVISPDTCTVTNGQLVTDRKIYTEDTCVTVSKV